MPREQRTDCWLSLRVVREQGVTCKMGLGRGKENRIDGPNSDREGD